MKLNANLIKATLVGALGGLLFGFDTAVISGTTHALRIVFNLDEKTLGVTVMIALLGTIVGSMFAGIPGQKYGGRETLRFLAACYVVSAIGCAFAWSWSSLLLFRFIGGLGIGGSSVMGPVYIAEIAPAKWRGRLVGTFQINIVIGILAAYLSNFLIARMGLGAAEWRWQFGVGFFPAAIFFALLFSIPRSARWLALQNRNAEARAVLESMGSVDPDAEMNSIIESIHSDTSANAESLWQWKYRFPIFLAITIGIFNQLAGINAILYYLNDIFAAAGFSKVSGNLQAVGVGAMNLLATLVGMSLIDKAGRKTLLLIGAAGMVGCLSGVAHIFSSQHHQDYLVWLLVAYIGFFAISQGSVIWVYIGEVFPNRVRSKGQSLGSSAHWITNAAIALTFPYVATLGSGAYPFIFFAGMTLLQFFVVLFVYPETKGISLEQMQHKLGLD